MTAPRFAAAMLALALPGLWGCGTGVECGPGTRAEGDACVPVCEPGTEIDARSGACVPVCVPGTRRDPASGACLPENARCVSGEVWDVETDQCLDASQVCAPGTTWVSGEAACVSLRDLPVDQFEGSDPNDYGPGTPPCERFTLPATGEAWTLGGDIELHEDVALTGEMDMDCWFFETDGPTLLRIGIDGLGGASPAFMVLSREFYDERWASATTSSRAERDLFLPAAGTYMLVTTDALTLYGTPFWHGGPAFGYRAKISRLPMPEPVPLELGPDGVEARGVLPPVPPEDGTTIAFYSIPAEAESLFDMDIEFESAVGLPLLAAVNTDGRPFEAGWTGMPKPVAFGDSGDVLVAVDFERLWAQEPLPYVFTMRSLPFEMIEGDGEPVTLEAPAWSQGHEAPVRRFGYRAREGEIVWLNLHSSTGRTCFFLWSDDFETYISDRGCMLAGAPVTDAAVRFLPERDGLYILELSDYFGGVVEGGALQGVPVHEFTFSAEIRHILPTDLSSVTLPSTVAETVTAEEYERFYTADPAPGDAFRFELSGSGGFTPHAIFYQLEDIVTPALTAGYVPWSERFLYRSVDGKPFLLGVADRDAVAGEFELLVSAFAPVEMGSLEEASVIEHTEVLKEGETHRYLTLTLDEPADLAFTVTPPSDVDLVIRPLHESLQSWPLVQFDAGEIGVPEGFVMAFPAGEVVLEVMTSEEQPVPHDAALELEVRRLGTPLLEQEPNDSHETAQELPLETLMAGREDGLGDRDWYRFVVTDPGYYDIITRPYGTPIDQNSRLVLFSADGHALADASSLPEYFFFERLEGFQLEAGTYYVSAGVVGLGESRYVLEVKHASR